MKTVILAAGQGISIIEKQLSVMHNCGIEDEDITIVAGYYSEVLKKD